MSDNDPFERALKAYEDIIIAELQGNKRGRFDRIMRLCSQATKLEQMTVKRVGDVQPGALRRNDGLMGVAVDYDDVGDNIIGPYEAIGAMQQMRQGPADHVDLVREMVMMLQPMIESQKESQTSKTQQAKINEQLTRLKAAEAIGQDATEIRARLKDLLTPQGDANAMDGAVVLRGYQAGASLGERNLGDGDQGNDGRGAGALEAAGEGLAGSQGDPLFRR